MIPFRSNPKKLSKDLCFKCEDDLENQAKRIIDISGMISISLQEDPAALQLLYVLSKNALEVLFNGFEGSDINSAERYDLAIERLAYMLDL